MEENINHNRTSRLIILLVIALTIIMALLGYLMNLQKVKADKEIAELKSREETLQTTITELQEKLNSINDIASNNESTGAFTDDEVKTALADVLELRSASGCDALLETLTKKGKLNYDPSKDNILDDGTMITTIKFSDYKDAMLNYVSEKEFDNNWTAFYTANSEGYITKVQGGGGFRVHIIKSINKIDNLTYTAHCTSHVDNEYVEENDYTFNVVSYNGKCVIDSIK